MNTDESLVQLLQITSKLSTQIEDITRRLDKVDLIVSNDVRQDQRILMIEDSLKKGNARFEKMEKRISVLEGNEGEKAKNLVKTVSTYLLTSVLSFITAAVVFYIMNKK